MVIFASTLFKLNNPRTGISIGFSTCRLSVSGALYPQEVSRGNYPHCVLVYLDKFPIYPTLKPLCCLYRFGSKPWIIYVSWLGKDTRHQQE